MLERFSFSSALPSFRYANARSERQNFGDGGTAEGNCHNIQRIAPRSVDVQMARHAGATTLASILYLQPLLVEPALFLRALGKLLLAPQHQHLIKRRSGTIT